MDEFDRLIHSPIRLKVMALLSGTNSASFSYLQETLEITPQNLSKQLKILADNGLLVTLMRRGPSGPETIVHATPRGLSSFAEHRKTLLRLLAGSDNA